MTVYLIGGSKGGVGKSLVSMAVIDYLQAQNKTVLLVESDTSNPDVWKAYKDDVASETLDMDGANGWIRLMNVIGEKPDHDVVINTAARNGPGVARNGKMFCGALEELGRKLVVLWVINRQRDSLELLKQFMEAMTSAHIHVVRNGYFGDEDKFELYNDSKLRAAIEGNGGKSVMFPDLADRVSDDLYSRRVSIAHASGNKDMPIGNRAELQRWRAQAWNMLEGVL